MGPPRTNTGSLTVGPPAASRQAESGVPIGTQTMPGFFTSPVTVEKFVRDGLAVKGVGHGHERADVGDHRAHHEGQAQRGNGTARHFADEGLFIPGGIEVGEQRQLDGPIADGIGQDLGGFLVFFLQCDDAALGTGGLHQLTERPDDFVGVVKHVMLVGVQKGLAFADRWR